MEQRLLTAELDSERPFLTPSTDSLLESLAEPPGYAKRGQTPAGWPTRSTTDTLLTPSHLTVRARAASGILCPRALP